VTGGCGHLEIAPNDPAASQLGLGGAALRYAALGLAVFPLVPGRKVPAIRGNLNAASADPARVTAWWGERPRYNVAIATGARSGGLFVLDLDTREDGRASLLAWLADCTHQMGIALLVPSPSNFEQGGPLCWLS
jgi:hypothetical protein